MDAVVRAEAMLTAERSKADRVLGGVVVGLFPVALALAAVHSAWIVALVAGALISGATLFVVRTRPGTTLSRMTVGAALMAYSALTIQETHGMTEMHFGIFVGLAFLTIYRDWRVPVFAGAVIAVHHVLFHYLQLQGIGIYVFSMPMHGLSGWGMVGLHAVFVVFEVAVLIYVARSLEADTRSQARMFVEQERDQATLVALADQLNDKTLSAFDADAASGAGDPAGAIAALRQGIGHVADLVSTINETAATVAAASAEMVASTSDTDKATTEIAESLSELADGAERQVIAIRTVQDLAAEVTQAVEASASSAARAAQATVQVRTAADEGSTAAAEATAAAQAVTSVAAEATTTITELAQKSGTINGIVETITDIASQTNLLALNAAIEAARAGESGRGFAVVADEVRKLAEESQAAAATISEIVDEVQEATRRAVMLVEESAERSATSASTAHQTGQAFERIVHAVDDLSEHSEQIATATGQIADGAERVRMNMDGAASVAQSASAATQHASAATEQTAASSEQAASSAELLSRSAAQLQSLVAEFTVS